MVSAIGVAIFSFSRGVVVVFIGIFGAADPISCACILGLPVVRKNANKTI